MGLFDFFSKGKTAGESAPDLRLDPDELNIAVKMTGGLGDTIIHARIIMELSKLVPKAHFYIFPAAGKAGQWIFKNSKKQIDILPICFFDQLSASGFDMQLYLNTFAIFNEQSVNFGKIRKTAPELLKIFASTVENRAPWEVFIGKHPFLDGAFAHMATVRGFNRYNFIPHMLGIPVPENELELPCGEKESGKILKKYPSYITLNTGFDESFPIGTATATKSYPAEQWNRVVESVRQEYPELGIVQVGGKNSIPVEGVHVDLAGKTGLEESAGVLKHSALHLDTEGGLVHVCASLGVPSAVLFGPTNLEYFAYPDNINIESPCCRDCWWATERWMEHCPRRKSQADCMAGIKPEQVMGKIRPVLQKIRQAANK